MGNRAAEIADGHHDFEPMRRTAVIDPADFRLMAVPEPTDPDEIGKVPAVLRTLRTAAKKRQFLRDMVIYEAHRKGVSKRELSRLFGLARSAVDDCLARIEAVRA